MNYKLGDETITNKDEQSGSKFIPLKREYSSDRWK